MSTEKHPAIFIKDIAIQLKNNFNFDNLPHEQSDSFKGVKPFIGRKELTEKFVQMLKSEIDDMKKQLKSQIRGEDNSGGKRSKKNSSVTFQTNLQVKPNLF